ncbi:Mito_carr domain-containing protein [Cephalotus follicularis]|uniref:Mito_carr domain-containing protein n=1 Tax=Cephalotus follicularis TaxID=3775 RepID=A0A1Q3CUM5_CEPFO|nr:Mito_carr domain-containing protein [Cephalotus follicularis]
MAACKKPPRRDQPSIKYRLSSVEGASFELTDFAHGECAAKQRSTKSEFKPRQIMGTAELISAVDQIWDRATHLAVLQTEENLNHNNSGCRKEDISNNMCWEETVRSPIPADITYSSVDERTTDRSPPVVQPILKFLNVTQKMSFFEPCSENNTHSSFWRFLQGVINSPNESWKGRGLTNVGFSFELGNMYQWMREIIPAGLQYPVNITEIEKKRSSGFCCPVEAVSHAGGCFSHDTTCPRSDLAVGDADSNSNLIKMEDPPSCKNANMVRNTRVGTSLCLDYLHGAVQDTMVDRSVLRNPSSSLCEDYHMDHVDSCNSTRGECQHMSDDNLLFDNITKQPEKIVSEDEKRKEINSSAHKRPQYGFAKQEHAFAGALAGISVSLCLHPVDTVKTVFQSFHADQKSIFEIGKSIVSERGLTGLYRGIASNIASSAPVSAVYTFTYESVKGGLLPHFPKEYYSLAHCVAGGCGSIATSFIFTPSEHIKQQMQVGSHYSNCWNALVGIIRKGGWPSLYTGLGAVLCRNVPHSIIKFYTYENLKQMMLPSLPSSAQPNKLQTLLCGGLAGSTAALFTTPFDVVKTRLQTQIPGSMSQYNSVHHALKEIGRHEGLKGLYRGLIPRLVIYMSQGAIFFASYEFFKSLFSLEVPQLNSQRIQLKENEEADTASLQSPYPLPSSL